MPFDVQGALKAGYSIDEIGNHVGFDVAGAKSAGYTDDEIMNHLSGSTTPQTVQPQSVPQQPGMLSKRIGAISNPTPSAVRDFSPTLGAALNVVGQVGGAIFDPAVALAKKGYDLLPESTQDAIKHGASRIAENPLVDAATTLFKAAPEGVQNDIGRIADASMIVPGVQAGRIGLKGAKEGVNIGRDAVTLLKSKTPQEIDKELSNVVQKGVEKAIRPSVVGKRTAPAMTTYYNKAKTAVKSIVENTDNLVLTDADGNAVKGLPKTLKQFSEAIDQTKKSIYQQYHDMATAAGEQGSLFDTTQIMTKLDDVSGDLKHNPEIRKYADSLKTEISELHGQPPEVIEARIADLNSSLSGFYEGRVSKAKAQVDASVANLMREELDNKIMNSVGPGYQDLKNQYGSLKTLEKEVSHRAIVDARKNNKGLFDLTDVFTNGEMVAGALYMNPILFTRGLVGKLSKESLKFWNNPNRIVKNMFGDAEDLLNRSVQSEMRSTIGKSLTGNAETLQKGDLGTLRYPGRPDINAGMELGPVRSGVTVGQPYGDNIGRIVPPKQLPAGQGFELQGAPTSPDVIDAHFTSTSRPIPALDIPRREPTLALPNGQGFELVNNPVQPTIGKIIEPTKEDFIGSGLRTVRERIAAKEIAKTREAENLVTRVQQLGGINATKDYNPKVLRQNPDAKRVLNNTTGKTPDSIANQLIAEGWPVESGDHLIELLKSGEGRTIYNPKLQDKLFSRDLRRKENDWIERQLKKEGITEREVLPDHQTRVIDEIREEGLVDPAKEEAALKEINNFFDEMSEKATRKIKPKKQSNEVGKITPRETIKGI